MFDMFDRGVFHMKHKHTILQAEQERSNIILGNFA